MKRTLAPMLIVAACACTSTLLLSACTPLSLPSSSLAVATPTPSPAPIPTTTPLAGTDPGAFDNGAGNCVDAANQAFALIGGASAGTYGNAYFNNMDMRLDLDRNADPSCAATGARLKAFRASVGTVRLTVYPLDGQWYYAGTVTRSGWLTDVLNHLRSLYPSANISVSVSYNNNPCGSASIGTGVGNGRQINGDCS